jgi:hypothetical protein
MEAIAMVFFENLGRPCFLGELGSGGALNYGHNICLREARNQKEIFCGVN